MTQICELLFSNWICDLICRSTNGDTLPLLWHVQDPRHNLDSGSFPICEPGTADLTQGRGTSSMGTPLNGRNAGFNLWYRWSIIFDLRNLGKWGDLRAIKQKWPHPTHSYWEDQVRKMIVMACSELFVNCWDKGRDICYLICRKTSERDQGF